MAQLVFVGLLLVVDVLYIRAVHAGGSISLRRLGSSVEDHRKRAFTFLASLIGYVLLLEFYVKFIGGAVFDYLFWAHMTFAVPLFVISLLMVTWFTGLRSKNHSFLGYLSMVCMVGSNITGLRLILMRF